MNDDYQLLINAPDEKFDAKSVTTTEFKIIQQPSHSIVLDIKAPSPLVDKNHHWLTIVSRYLGHRDLSRLSGTCRFFSRQTSFQFMDFVTANKHKIVKLSITLAQDYAHDKVSSGVAAGGEMAHWSERDRENEVMLRKKSLVGLLNNDQSVLLEMKFHYKKNQICLKIGMAVFWFLIVGPISLMIYSMVSNHGQDIKDDLAGGFSIGIALMLFCCCYKCGLIRVLSENPHAVMIKEIEQSFAQLSSRNLLPGDLFPAQGSTRRELQDLQLLSIPVLRST